ncbi:Beta-barrel assembly machine subunit BamB [Pseudomonas duriflava]|uniref:Outer membrane protein assembly factor BamB n=1 Tax=Pseudomonas duriflava TaxID=459528 RepID=A0A562QFC9_9PSED|nr:outer membrane protein assembly factor BamB [Pseudomonas duriflava]TWI55441.1 Beta-barrel assembly machine subunit BamB [Pseudomonas duriflava]
MLRWKQMVLVALALAVVGCSSSKTKELPPAELQEFTSEVQLKEQWSRSIGEGQGETYNQLTPAVDGQSLYVTDSEGLVMALNRESGDVIWKKELDVPVSGGVGAGYGLVLLGTLRGEVIALDAASGDEKWRSRASSEVLAPPVTNGDIVVAHTQDDKLFAFDASTGDRRWLYEESMPVLTLRGTGAPVVTNRYVVAGLSSGKVIALDTQRGLPLWEQVVAVPQGRSELDRMVDINGGMLLSGSTLYVTTYHGRVAGLDLESGRMLWQRDASSYTGVAEGFGNVYVSLDNGTVEAVDQNSSSALWSNESLARRQLSAPAVLSSYVVVGDFEGYIHLLSQVDGHMAGREKLGNGGIRVRPLVDGDWMYVYGNGGKLVAYTIR